MISTKKSIVQSVRFQISENQVFNFDIKRDDLIDEVVSGNKWRKLEYNLLKANELNKIGILTFGGAFSNHLVATARATQLHNLKAIGIVRGNELTASSNHTLRACAEYGMELQFVSRDEYRNKEEEYCKNNLACNYLDYYIVPEGGRNYYGMLGCQSILQETQNKYNHVYLAGGTGTTGAGVLLGADESTKIHVISALKGGFLAKEIEQLLLYALFDEEIVNDYMQRLIVDDDSHFGGYAKVSDELFSFINEVFEQTGIKLDPIYTGKAFYRLIEDFKSQKLTSSDNVLFVHTGGLQGANSWKNKIVFL